MFFDFIDITRQQHLGYLFRFRGVSLYKSNPALEPSNSSTTQSWTRNHGLMVRDHLSIVQ